MRIMNSIPRKFLVTGANGYVGSRVVEYLREQAYTVYELRHRISDEQNEFIFSYTLEEEVRESIFENVDVLIHCAYDFRWTKWEDIKRVNVDGSIRLLKAAKKNGVKRIVYISTISAFEGCKSLYGQAKMQVEQVASDLGGAIVRPGLVYGKETQGMVGALNKGISISKILPLVGKGDYIQYLAYDEDLCQLILKLSQEKTVPNQPVIAASPNKKTFQEILHILAKMHNKKILFIPIPWRFMWLGLKLCEILGIKLGFRSDSLVSLVNQDPQPNFENILRMDIHFREFIPTLLVE